MHSIKRTVYYSLLLLALPGLLGTTTTPGHPSKSQSINLNARSVVLGPEVTLGNVSQILMPDGITKAKLLSIKVGSAPPPGESCDIQLSYIKRCLRVSGFEKYTTVLNGPRTIRVVTAQFEIDKALLREEFALNTSTPAGLLVLKKKFFLKLKT